MGCWPGQPILCVLRRLGAAAACAVGWVGHLRPLGLPGRQCPSLLVTWPLPRGSRGKRVPWAIGTCLTFCVLFLPMSCYWWVRGTSMSILLFLETFSAANCTPSYCGLHSVWLSGPPLPSPDSLGTPHTLQSPVWEPSALLLCPALAAALGGGGTGRRPEAAVSRAGVLCPHVQHQLW